MMSPGRPGNLHPTPERVRLANGLTAVLQPHDAAEVAAVQLWVRAGARDETAGRGGAIALHRAPAVQGDADPRAGRDRRDDLGPRRRDERGHVPGLDVLPRRPAGHAPRHGARHPGRRGPARRVRPGRGRARATRGAGGDPARRGHAERRALAHPVPRPLRRARRTGGRSWAPPRPSPACRTRRSSTTSVARTCRTTRRWSCAGSMPVAESLDAVTRGVRRLGAAPAPGTPPSLARSARRASPAPRIEGAPPDVPRHGLERRHPARPRRLRARPRRRPCWGRGARRG